MAESVPLEEDLKRFLDANQSWIACRNPLILREKGRVIVANRGFFSGPNLLELALRAYESRQLVTEKLSLTNFHKALGAAYIFKINEGAC